MVAEAAIFANRSRIFQKKPVLQTYPKKRPKLQEQNDSFLTIFLLISFFPYNEVS